MTWTRRHTVLAGLALILGANAVVLGGVAYNRGGEPEALLRLTERELTNFGSWGFARENSGLAMHLQWRVAAFRSESDPQPDLAYGSYLDAAWLNEAKLAELGFDLSRPPRGDDYDLGLLPRGVFYVLEMDGPAYQAALQRAERRLATAEGRLAASPEDRALRASVDGARAQLNEVRNRETRLYIVDAALDPAALRAKYSDRARYAIVQGRVSVYRSYDSRTRERPLRGQVSSLAVVEINVPLELRRSIDRNTPFEAVVAFGRRLEPWFVSAAPRARPPSN